MAATQAHVAPWKKEEVQELVALIEANPVIAVVNVQGIPAAQMAKMRKSLREDATIKVSKNTLLTLALKEAGKKHAGLDKLADKIDGQTALIATKMNPFRLYKRLEQSKSKAPARGGEVAPEDIKVYKGETQFKPGPIVGELQKAGIPAKIDQGKVMISADKVLVKQGDRIPQDVAQMLTRLEIFPLIVGMDLKAAFDEGTVYGIDALSVDYLASIIAAHQQAMNLAVNAPIPAKGAIDLTIATYHARALAVASKMMEKDPNAVSDAVKEALANRATAAPAAGAAPAAKAEEKEEEKGPTEEEAAAGLGALFG